MTTLHEKHARTRRIFRGEKTDGEGIPAEQAKPLKASNRHFVEKYGSPITRPRTEQDVFPIGKEIRELNPPGRGTDRAARQTGGPRMSRAAGGEGR